MARAGDDDVAEQIKNCFREFDKDGNGSISKYELRQVLQRLSKGKKKAISKEEIDKCVEEADTNENGLIEYEEFVDWVMRPGSKVQASKQGAALFDFEAVLKPLFQAFDRNGNGVISKEEFQECFLILQNAIKLSHTNADRAAPDLLERDVSEVFKVADEGEGSGAENQEIDFAEFVAWQRKALERSGLLSEDLKDLVPALARQLQRIFRFSEAAEKGSLKEEDNAVLARVVDNLATFTRDIWNEDFEAHSSLYGRHHYANRWSEPPVGLNVERLMRWHMQGSRIRVKELQKQELQVFCLPENVSEDLKDMSKRRWIARISQGYGQHLLKERAGNKIPFEYYMFYDLRWERHEDGEAIFEEALNNFSVDMRFFCLLKTQANFGVSISWWGIQQALKNAVAFGLITAEQHKNYNEKFEAEVLHGLREEGILHGLSADEKKQKLQETLAGKNMKVTAKSVMGALVEQGVLRVSSKLADCIDA